MNPIDRAILESCEHDFRPLKPLRQHIAGGTLYRHANRLVQLGWLRRESGLYRATEAGFRQLAEARSGRQWDYLEQLYPPLRLVPTPVHRAQVGLIFAAVAARQHALRPDRHPVFAAAGGTLHWKTSCGEFVCHALGLDPAVHVVDCASETGKSLGVRRSGTGEPTFRRELLDAPFVVFDEFLSAEPSARTTLGLFLSGRLTLPFENEQLTVRPVPLLTLNPRDKPTLEGQLGLSAPQIRRALVANLDAVPMPDLAATGQQALSAAQAHGPLALSAPAGDCQAYHRPIVELVRQVILPEAYARVDVEVVITLCSGMTSLIQDPAEAIAQVGHALGVLAETTDWAQPGWIEAVTHFSLTPTAPRSQVRPEPEQTAAPPPHAPAGSDGKPSPLLSLQLPRAAREPGLPSLALSDALRGHLTWLAVETGRSLEETLTVLITFYLRWRQGPHTLSILKRILLLARQLEIAQVDVDTLHGYVQARAALSKYQRSLEDVPEALRLIDVLAQLPEPWDWARVETTINSLASLIHAGITPDQLRTVLVRHRQLETLGFDEPTAERVAVALVRAGATGVRRSRVLRSLVLLAGSFVDVADVEQKRQRLEARVNRLETERLRLSHLVEEATSQLAHLKEAVAVAQQRHATLEAESGARSSDLEVLRALRAFLLGQSAPLDAFWRDLEQVRELRRLGLAPDERYALLATDQLRSKLFTFIQQLLAELPST